MSRKNEEPKTKVKDFLPNVDTEVLKVLIEHSKPSDKIGGVQIKPITQWRFCDVMDMSDKGNDEMLLFILKRYAFKMVEGEKIPVEMSENDLIDSTAGEFVALIKHIQSEFKKVSILMEQLKQNPNTDLQNAGINKMDAFGVMGIYYSIDKDPCKWDAISEQPFGIIYTRLMIDKVQGEIHEAQVKQMQEKQRNQIRR